MLLVGHALGTFSRHSALYLGTPCVVWYASGTSFEHLSERQLNTLQPQLSTTLKFSFLKKSFFKDDLKPCLFVCHGLLS